MNIVKVGPGWHITLPPHAIHAGAYSVGVTLTDEETFQLIKLLLAARGTAAPSEGAGK